MTTKIKLLAFMFVAGLSFNGQIQAQHQRRDNYQDHNDSRPNYHDGNSYGNRDNGDRQIHDRNNYNHNNRSYFDHNQRDRYYSYQYRGDSGVPPWAYHQRTYPHTRYIYFRDSGIYYDCNRSTYITISGRNWSVSTALPQPICRTNTNRIAYEEVNYYGDNVYEYHNQHYYNQR